MAFDKFLWKSFLPADFERPAEKLEKSGILLIDKPEGITSMDILRLVKILGGVKKAGHAGTLDPLATGLMIVLVNKATRLSSKLMEGSKEYEGTMDFGQEYDTQDTTGNPVGEKIPFPNHNIEKLNQLAKSLSGEISQIPPVYSAIKKQGKPLYEYARSAKEIHIESRKVTVHQFDITEVSPEGRAKFYVHCEKGVYVRTLVHDLGKLAGCNAAMSQLRRTRIGPYKLEQAKKLKDFKNQDDIKNSLFLPDEFTSG